MTRISLLVVMAVGMSFAPSPAAASLRSSHAVVARGRAALKRGVRPGARMLKRAVRPLGTSRATRLVRRLFASAFVAWGAQVAGAIASRVSRHAPAWLGGMGKVAGVTGGAVQFLAGIAGLSAGRSRRQRYTGALDVGVGVTWMAASVTGDLCTAAACVGLSALRVVVSRPRWALRALRWLGWRRVSHSGQK